MLYVIDGTGAWLDSTYDSEMALGFCKTMALLYHGEYERGPSIEGSRTFEKAEKFAREIIAMAPSARTPLYLAGHSRGGAAVIRLAQILRDHRIVVKAMFLFDAVDRTTSNHNVQLIPTNVRTCYHARRKRSFAQTYEKQLLVARKAMDDCMVGSFGNRAKCRVQIEAYQKLDGLDRTLKYAMRTHNISAPHTMMPSIDFGNCGVAPEPICNLNEIQCTYIQHEFEGTHGAIGGAPIIDDRAGDLLIKSDAAAVQMVQAWMWSHIKREGLGKHVFS